MRPEASKPSSESKIHVVVFPRGEWLIAQCLEYDIATRARLSEGFTGLRHEVERILAVHILGARREGSEPFANIPKAPKRFWEMYKDASVRLEPVRDGGLELPADTPRPVLELRAA